MKQINLNSKWVLLIKYLVVAIIFHFILGWFGGCSDSSKEENIQEVTITEIKGSFKSIKPDSKPLEIKIAPAAQVKINKFAYVENPLSQKLSEENKKLKSEYSKMSDSLKSKTYNAAIELKSFSSKFENDTILLNINGIVRGEVQEITPSYIIKSRKIDVVTKQTVFRVLAGGSAGMSKDFNQLIYKVGFDFQNRKGNIISAEYLQVGNQGFYMAGYKKSILNIKR